MFEFNIWFWIIAIVLVLLAIAGVFIAGMLYERKHPGVLAAVSGVVEGKKTPP